jgi:hypothetical protein
MVSPGAHDRAADRRADRDRRERERNLKTADAVVKAMMIEGVALCVTHLPNRSQWQLSDGAQVSEVVATLAIAHPHVVGVGDSLIGDPSLSQTFKYFKTQKEEEPTI